MSSEAVDKLVSGAAWEEFCDLLKKAGNVIAHEGIAADEFERAEGMRYLSRLLRAGLVSFVESTGAEHPVFKPMPDLVKMGLDNPDNYYVSASVNGNHRYRIRGHRRSIHYLSFAAQNQNFSARDKITGGAGHLNDSELALEPDGSFEIIASREREGTNWLEMNPDTKQILVRQTFLHRDREQPVDLEIECLDVAAPAPRVDPERIGGQLLGSAMYAIGCAQWFVDWALAFDERAPVNAFHFPDAESHRRVGGDPNIRMWLGRWEVAPGQALVIEATPPECHYWNFQLGNVWAESLDSRFQRVHINNGDAELRADGSFRLVVAHEDPGVANWISTAGHRRGLMALRWVRASSHPEPRCKVVRADEIDR